MMIAVIFEAIPAEGQKEVYLDIASALRPELAKIEGFLSIERFQSLSNPEKVLSLSFWADEAAIEQWRNLELHRKAQNAGRSSVFQDYRLRIGNIVRDYGLHDRHEAPSDSKAAHHQ